jgi:hypothetical protein
MNKLEIIKKYLLEGDNVKEKFEIAWDIWQYFEKIKLSMRKKVLSELVNKIKNSEEFNDYEVKDEGLLECEKWSPLRIYKKDWVFEGIIPLSYAIESDKNNCFDLYFGIEKWNDDEGIPFKGNWEKEKIPIKWKNTFVKMKDNLFKISKDWKVSDNWIVWKWFNGYYSNM